MAGGAARARRVARSTGGVLRSASRILGARARGRQPLSHLSRDGASARAVCEGDGLHAHRAAAGDGASVLGIVGLSGARVLCADEPFRPARRLQVPGRRLSSGRPGCRARLGTRAFPERRPRPCAIRRHGAVRARRPAAGRAPGLGHAHLQLRPQRGEKFPAVERAVLARGVSRGRPPRRCRRVDAVPRLLAHRRPVDSQPLRRAREPRNHRLPAAAQHADARRAPGVDHRRRRINVVAGGEPPGASGGPGLHVQMEHGVDARRPGVRPRGSGASALASHPGDLLGALHALGKLHPAVFA